MSRLRDLYENEITKKMTDKFGYKNPMMVPKIDKIEMCIRDRAYRAHSAYNRPVEIF